MERELVHLIDVETSVRRMRWVGLAALPVLVVAFQPPPEVVLPVGKPAFTVVVAAALLLLQARSTAIVRARDPERLARFGIVSVAATLALVLAVLFVFGVDPTSRFWPLLVVPVIEGAHRAGLRGAWALWALGSVGYVVEQVVHLDTKPEPGSWVSAILWGVAILAIVAGGAGTLAARTETERRRERQQNRRLHQLADTSLRLTSAAATSSVAAATLDAVGALTGATRASFHVRDEEGGWSLVEQRGLEVDAAALSGPSPHLDALLRSATSIGPLTPEPGLAELGVGEQLGVGRLVAIPLTSQDEVVGATVVGIDDRVELDEDREQLLRMLASQAGVALQAVRFLAEHVDRNRRLQELNDLRDEFTSILTHELRSPMTAINGYALLLRDRWQELEDERRGDFLEQIVAASERVTRLTSDILQIARAESKGFRIEAEPVDLEALARSVAEAEIAASDAHVLSVHVSPPIPRVIGDPERLHQVVQNLVSNAIKYSPDGGRVTLGLAAEEDAVVLTVADDGIGITEEHLTTVFEKFSRASDDARIQGTGLGLYLTRMLVEAMGGTIRVTSAPGAGSTFTVRFSVAVERPTEIETPRAEERST